MIQAITKERWQQAQIAEAAWFANSQESVETYRRSFECYFRYLGMSFNQEGKTIVEPGCAAFPAVGYCVDVQSIIIEPLYYRELESFQGQWIQTPLEEMDSLPSGDEVWILNCLQHVIDPELFVEKCKQIAPVIRFFEPIDFGISDCHPHAYSIDDFIRWFGHAERYHGGSDEGFHTADCAYGTWKAA